MFTGIFSTCGECWSVHACLDRSWCSDLNYPAQSCRSLKAKCCSRVRFFQISPTLTWLTEMSLSAQTFDSNWQHHLTDNLPSCWEPGKSGHGVAPKKCQAVCATCFTDSNIQSLDKHSDIISGSPYFLVEKYCRCIESNVIWERMPSTWGAQTVLPFSPWPWICCQPVVSVSGCPMYSRPMQNVAPKYIQICLQHIKTSRLFWMLICQPCCCNIRANSLAGQATQNACHVDLWWFVCVCNAAKGLKRKTPKPKKPSAVCWHFIDFMVPRNLVQWLPAGFQPGPGRPGSPVAVSALSANEACHAVGRHTANRPVGTFVTWLCVKRVVRQTMAIPKSTGFSSFSQIVILWKFGWFPFLGKPRNQPERDKYVTA